MKRSLALLLAVMLFVSSLYISGNNLSEVEASSATTTCTGEELLEKWGIEPAKVDGKIFAGWYEDEEYTSSVTTKPTEYTEDAVYYAKYVDEDIFSLKLQVEKASDGTYNLRLISSVDTLNYRNVGFNVYFDDQDVIEYRQTTVFERIKAVHTENEYIYSPKVVSESSEYMFTGTVKKISAEKVNTEFYVIPCVTTFDGVISYGPSRMFTVNDGLSESAISLTVQAANPGTDTVSVTVGTKAVTAEVIGYSDDGYLHLRVPAVRSEMDSNTTITYGNISTVYHNLESASESDTSWYYENEDSDVYYISTVEDFYGLAELVNVEKNIFTGKTIYLISDLQINEVKDGTVAAWVAGTETPAKAWVPIGYWGTMTDAGDTMVYFDGTFDGQGHTISGLYGKNATVPVGGSSYYGFGLFTAINENGAVKNLKIDDCYFNPNKNGIGIVTGMLYGTIDNVYVGENSYLYSTKLAKGGIAGRTYGGTISNCWFDGTIYGSATNGYLGGIVGQVDYASALTNCLFTGDITLTNAGSSGNGGLVSHIFNGGSVAFTNCIFAGTMKNTKSDATGVASIIGSMKATSSISLNNVYMLSKPLNSDNSVIAEESGILGVGYRSSTTNCTVNGSVIMPSDYSDLYKTFNLDYWSEDNEEGAWTVSKTNSTIPVLKEFSELTEKDIVSGNSGTTASDKWYTSKVYDINTVADLYGLADLVNNQGVSMEGITIKLAKDLDLNPGWNAATKVAPENGRTWVAIGTKDSPFKGTFTGKTYTIRGLYMAADAGCQGLFGYVENGTIKNLNIENSYYDFTGKVTAGSEGSVVGTLVNGKLYNVNSDVEIKTINGYTGGLVGSASNADIEYCSYEGNILVVDNASATVKEGYGGILGNLAEGSIKIYDCLVKGNVEVNRQGNSLAAGIVGIAADNSSVTVQKSLMAGSILFSNVLQNDSTGVTSKITDVYTVAVDKTDGILNVENGLATNLTSNGISWVNLYSAKGEAIHPVLKQNDGVIRVLLVGNSFCYYHTDELYGMLASDGPDAIVANVYESGCPVKDHWTWLNSGAEKYNYITVTEDGRVDSKYYSLKYCLEQEDWDVISLQQHFNPGTADTYEASANTNGTLTYSKYLYDYFKANYPKAKLLWQQTWAYQKGYQGPSGSVSTDTSQHVLTEEKQTRNYENIRAVAIEVCRQNNVQRVPNGDAWQIARSVVGDILCDKSGTDLAADTTKTDNYHDGDAGGGQFLNACGWYEVITGKDCRDNKYVPSYDMLINTEFNSNLTSKTDVINALKEAAHQAVVEMNQ